MKKIAFYLFVIYCFNTTTKAQNIVRTQLPDTVSHWKSNNKVGFDLTQVSFVNWNAGGNNSVSGILKGHFIKKYQTQKMNWHSEMIVKYGINKQDGQQIRKTDDVWQINSTAGFKSDSTSSWFYSAKFNFSTQFTEGYAYPNTSLSISSFFAPAYVFLGAGAEYVAKEAGWNVYISPLTQKTTLVLNQRLANQGAFGVDKAILNEDGSVLVRGKKSRTQLGVLLTNQYKKEVFKNIILDHRLSVYSDYINQFGNIDFDWQLQLDLIVNQYVRANIGTNLIYDDDIKIKRTVNGVQEIIGPRLQFKQILGVGMVYLF